MSEIYGTDLGGSQWEVKPQGADGMSVVLWDGFERAPIEHLHTAATARDLADALNAVADEVGK